MKKTVPRVSDSEQGIPHWLTGFRVLARYVRAGWLLELD